MKPIEGKMTDSTPMPRCPMAGMCKGMMEKRGFGLMLLIPGLIFIVLGILVLIEPRILLWLVALALIAMGIGMLMFSRFMRSFGEPST